MERQHVQSSNIRSVGYDEDSMTLEVEFHSGDIYHYFNVPESVYSGLINAASKGSYLNNHIKGRFQYRKIR